MAINDARAGWVVALIAICIAAIGGMITVSARAGAIEVRVQAVEQRQAAIDGKLDSIADAVARIEGKLSK